MGSHPRQDETRARADLIALTNLESFTIARSFSRENQPKLTPDLFPWAAGDLGVNEAGPSALDEARTALSESMNSI